MKGIFKMSRFLSVVMILLFVSGCGKYSNPPQQFKDSYIVLAGNSGVQSGKGELGTIDEFEKGLSKLVLNNGKSPVVHGWKKNDNTYILCFSMKDEEMEAGFTHILGGVGISSEDQGKISTIDYMADSNGKGSGPQTATIIALANDALSKSGVETSIAKYKKQQELDGKRAQEEIDEKQREDDEKNRALLKNKEEWENFIVKVADNENGTTKIPSRFIQKLKEMHDSGQLQTVADAKAYLEKNATEISNVRNLEKYLADEFNGPGETENPLYRAIWDKMNKGQINSVEEAKAFMKANGRDSDKIRGMRAAEEYRTSLEVDMARGTIPANVYDALGQKIRSGEIYSVDQAKSYLTSNGVSLDKIKK